jgi:hypothetical protein
MRVGSCCAIYFAVCHQMSRKTPATHQLLRLRPYICRFRRLKHGGAGARLKPLVDVVVHSKSVNSALVVDGYQCINISLNTVRRVWTISVTMHPACCNDLQSKQVRTIAHKLRRHCKSLKDLTILSCCNIVYRATRWVLPTTCGSGALQLRRQVK